MFGNEVVFDVFPSKTKPLGQRLLLVCKACSRVHASKLVVVLFASASKQLLAELQDVIHVHGAQVEQILVKEGVVAVLFLLDSAIAVFGLGVAIRLRFDICLDRFILGVGVEAFGICDDASKGPGSSNPSFPALRP